MNQLLNITSTIQKLVLDKEKQIEQWFADNFIKTSPFIYNSVDIRRSDFKIAPVDTNIFPGGFNNLNLTERHKSSLVIKQYLNKYYPSVKNILILAEDHTRNLFYFENIAVLKQILVDAGFNVILSSFSSSNLKQIQTFTSASGTCINLVPMSKINNKITTSELEPDLIIINNDLSDGIPDLISSITQPIVPEPYFGWHKRRKTAHFSIYNEMAEKFAHAFSLDPWLISTIFSQCDVVNFKEQTGIDCLAENVEQTIARIKAKYLEYKITEEPYVFIKPNRGTYGMGIMIAKSGDDVLNLNKDKRKHMNAIKGGITNTEVIIQEGIATIDTINNNPAEPMIYVIGGQPIGCIYRVNNKQGRFTNLNSSGMSFISIKDANPAVGLCSTLGLIARLACFSSAWECYIDSYQI